MTNIPYLISIDGPAASGKSSLSCFLAKKLKWKWLSTGVFYRGLAWMMLNQAGNPQSNIVQLAKDIKQYIRLELKQTAFIYKGQDRTKEIYTEEVDKEASKLANSNEVRQALLPVQQSFFKENPNGLIAEGRDCGTVVFPNASLKFYLKARDNIRAERRAHQRELSDVEKLSEDQRKRDKQDSSRKNSPLIQAKEAIVIDTGKDSLDKIVEKAYQHALNLFQNA